MDHSWLDRAACNNKDPYLWFAETTAEKNRAKAICETCPVKSECLAFGRKYGRGYGIWGGVELKRHDRTETGANRDVRHTRTMEIAEAKFRRTIANMGGKVTGVYRASYLPVAVICPHGNETTVRPDNAGRQAMCRCVAPKLQYFQGTA